MVRELAVSVALGRESSWWAWRVASCPSPHFPPRPPQRHPSQRTRLNRLNPHHTERNLDEGGQVVMGCGCKATGVATVAAPAASTFMESRPLDMATCRCQNPTDSARTYGLTRGNRWMCMCVRVYVCVCERACAGVRALRLSDLTRARELTRRSRRRGAGGDHP